MREQVIKRVEEEKIIAIVRGVDKKDILNFAKAVYEGGIRLLEVTYNAADPSSDEETASKMTTMLQGVINGGTGLRLRTRRYDYSLGWETPIAGKTGTTQNNSDGWFIAYVPSLITGVWVGGEDRDIHFDNLRNGQGSATALPIWGKFMNKVYNDSTLGYSRTEQFVLNNKYDCPKGSGEIAIESEESEMILFD